MTSCFRKSDSCRFLFFAPALFRRKQKQAALLCSRCNRYVNSFLRWCKPHRIYPCAVNANLILSHPSTFPFHVPVIKLQRRNPIPAAAPNLPQEYPRTKERSLQASFFACGQSLLRQNSLPPHGDPCGAFLGHRTQFPMT
jgi:hypothetical protein